MNEIPSQPWTSVGILSAMCLIEFLTMPKSASVHSIRVCVAQRLSDPYFYFPSLAQAGEGKESDPWRMVYFFCFVLCLGIVIVCFWDRTPCLLGWHPTGWIAKTSLEHLIFVPLTMSSTSEGVNVDIVKSEMKWFEMWFWLWWTMGLLKYPCLFEYSLKNSN